MSSMGEGVEMATGKGRKRLDAWQGAVGFVGITLGLLPQVQVLLGRGPGLWRAILGGESGSSAYVLPLAVIAAAVAVIAWLEAQKRTS
jgi:hypothetical protein